MLTPISCLAEQTPASTQVLQIGSSVVSDTVTEQPQQEVTRSTKQIAQSESSSNGAIKSVSPDEFSTRLSSLFEIFYESIKPVVSKLAMFLIAVAGLFLLVGLFSHKVMGKAVVAILAVGLGFLIFSNAEAVVGIITYTSEYLFGGR